MPINLLTNHAAHPAKTADQKTTTALKALYNVGFSQLLPRYPQPPPQQTGTSQNDDKTGIYRVYMSRFSRVAILFSTICGNPVGASLPRDLLKDQKIARRARSYS
jgi:hypothetical protein